MGQFLSKHSWVWRSCYWLAIATAYTAFHVTGSIEGGKLALPPRYDDVSYLSQGAQWLNAWKTGGFSALWSAPVAHSPTSVCTAFLGFLIFGPHLWAPYALNGIYVWLFLLGLDYLARGLPTYQRLLLPLTALTYPLLANLVMEFRPDILCSMTTAYLLALVLKTNWLQASKPRILILGLILGFALLSKTSIFPMTIVLTTAAISVTALADYWHKLDMRLLLSIASKILQILGIGILLACPYYIHGGLQYITGYIGTVMTGPNRSLWEKSFSLLPNLLYYINGNGSMLGNWLYLDLIFIVFALLLGLKLQRRKGLAATIIFLVVYVSVTTPVVKSPFLGVIVTALLLLAGYQAMQYLLLRFNQSNFLHLKHPRRIVLSSLCIVGLGIYQWQAYPYLGGGVSLVQGEKLLALGRPLKTLSTYFASLAMQSPQKQIKCFLSTNFAYINIDNLQLNLQLQGIGTIIFYDIAINESDIDRPDSYFNKIESSDYIIFPRSPQVQYPRKNPKVKQQNINMGEEIAQYLDRSSDFQLVQKFDMPSIDGSIEIYGRTSTIISRH